MKHAIAVVSLLIATLLGRLASAAPVFKDEENGIVVNVGVLAQPTFQMTAPGSNGTTGCGPGATQRCGAGIGNPRGTGPSYELFLRRARLLVWGSATKKLSFFAGTDEPNIGKGGTFTSSTFVEDAFLTYTFEPELRIDAGLMLVPLAHHTIESATSLHALDYHSDLVRFPSGRFFRDVGVQFRGLALNEMLHYRLGIWEGVRNGTVPQPADPSLKHPALNGGGIPRFTLHLRGNIAGSEPDFFLKGIYFSDKPIVSLGVGADYQPKAVFKPNGRPGDYLAASGDLFVEYPLTAQDEIIFKANYFFYAKGSLNPANATAPVGTNAVFAHGANAGYAELGFRHDFIEPVVFVDVLKGNRETVSVLAPHAGVNLWVAKHSFNVKSDFGYKQTKRLNAATQTDLVWTTQAQLFF